MLNTRSGRSKYVLAALLGAAAGGFTVALAPRVVPKMMSAMCAQMHAMMSEMDGPGCAASGTCAGSAYCATDRHREPDAAPG